MNLNWLYLFYLSIKYYIHEIDAINKDTSSVTMSINYTKPTTFEPLYSENYETFGYLEEQNYIHPNLFVGRWVNNQEFVI